MTAEIISIFSHKKFQKPKQTTDQLLERFMLICLYGSREEQAMARTEYYTALFNALPSPYNNDRPCDTEQE